LVRRCFLFRLTCLCVRRSPPLQFVSPLPSFGRSCERPFTPHLRGKFELFLSFPFFQSLSCPFFQTPFPGFFSPSNLSCYHSGTPEKIPASFLLLFLTNFPWRSSLFLLNLLLETPPYFTAFPLFVQAWLLPDDLFFPFSFAPPLDSSFSTNTFSGPVCLHLFPHLYLPPSPSPLTCIVPGTFLVTVLYFFFSALPICHAPPPPDRAQPFFFFFFFPPSSLS